MNENWIFLDERKNWQNAPTVEPILDVFSRSYMMVNTPQDINYTATCLPSRKLYKLDEPDTLDTAGEARTNSSVM